MAHSRGVGPCGDGRKARKVHYAHFEEPSSEFREVAWEPPPLQPHHLTQEQTAKREV